VEEADLPQPGAAQMPNKFLPLIVDVLAFGIGAVAALAVVLLVVTLVVMIVL
jgi:hypothetical protein